MTLVEFDQLVAALLKSQGGGKQVRAEVRRAFELFDADGSGSLSVDELHPALQKLGLECSAAETARILREVDSSNDGVLDVGEFAELVERVERFQGKSAAAGGKGEMDVGVGGGNSSVGDDVRKAFALFDKDGSGGLSSRELSGALSKLGVDASTKEAIAVLRRFDADGDGVLTLIEFDQLVSTLLQAETTKA
uniref:EF-hand domain-containing protein n=1 Tax=Chrysotila carterae TaxID=13221 RepID=A0A7S4BFB9_CHRCT